MIFISIDLRCLIIKTRLQKIKAYMFNNNLESFLISKPENIRYLSGFTGGNDARLFLTAEKQYIISDSRYREQIAQQCPEWDLVEEKNFDGSQFRLLVGGINNMAFESHITTHAVFYWLQENLPVVLIPVTDTVENVRIIKDETELKLIRRAAAIGNETFNEIAKQIGVGMSEREIANRIDYLMRHKGCEKEAFATIVVAGQNAALPHGNPGEKKVAAGEMITMDYGGFYQGYLADMTRTIAVGKMNPVFYDNYMAVLEAQQLGVSMVKAGAVCKDIDQAVRARLESYGLGKYFLHSTGHGVGLEVHEMPTVSANSDTVLQSGMVITIEPGVYIKGWGGIRIEDTVIVKENGSEIVTTADKNLIQINGGIR